MANANDQLDVSLAAQQEHPYARVVELGVAGAGNAAEWVNHEEDAGSRDASEGHGSLDSSQDRPTLTLNQDPVVTPSASPATGPLSGSGAQAQSTSPKTGHLQRSLVYCCF